MSTRGLQYITSDFGADISISASFDAPRHSLDTLSEASALSLSTRAASSAYSSLSISTPRAETEPVPPCDRMIDSNATMKHSGENTSP